LFLKHSTSAGLIGSYPPLTSLIYQFPLVALYTTVGAFFMTLWKDVIGARAKDSANNNNNSPLRTELYQRMSNSVAASAGTGLLAGLLLPVSAAGPIFCGSFVAMSAPTKIQTYGGLLTASVLAGLAHQGLAGALLGGWGGRLGTMAFLGVLGHNIIASKLSQWKQQKGGAETTSTTTEVSTGDEETGATTPSQPAAASQSQ
jgi:hypothetical protein